MKSRRNTPSKTGHNWKSDNMAGYQSSWEWVGKDSDGSYNESYVVSEISGPGIPLYQCYASFREGPAEPWIHLAAVRQLKTPQEMFKLAFSLHKQLVATNYGGLYIGNAREWRRVVE